MIFRLVTLNVALTFALGTFAAHYLAELSWPVAMMFGAIIVVTGPTVIMPLLKQASLKQRPAALLRWEGIVNDPVGALLVVLIYGAYTHAGGDSLVAEIITGLGISLIVSLVPGIGAGLLIAQAFRSGQVPEYLKYPLILIAVLGVYSIANRVQGEAGLLATTILGITLANQHISALHEMKRFKEYVTVLLVSVAFIVLTADIQPEILQRLDWRSWLLLALVIAVFRPIAIYLSTLKSDITRQERILLGWIAPRGIVAAAVAGLFGAELTRQGYAGAELLLPLVFALIVLTVGLHGLSIGWLARRLDLAAPPRDGILLVGAAPWSINLAAELHKNEFPVVVVDSRSHSLQPARMEHIQTHYGEVLSERTEEVLELSHITKLLATTPNEAYNTLVCSRFGPELGHHNVFELGWPQSGESASKIPSKSLRGRTLFDEDLTYQTLTERQSAGWRFETSRLSQQIGMEDALTKKPPEAELVAAIDDKGSIFFHPWNDKISNDALAAVITCAPPGSA